jgi:frataxin
MRPPLAPYARYARLLLPAPSLNHCASGAAALPLRVPLSSLPGHCSACRWHSALPHAPPPPPPGTPLPEARFHALADATLEGLELRVTALEDAVAGFDLTFAMGVLTLRLGAKGTYVLNKQAPNRQIWWSSPVSGPRRYGWDAQASQWVNTRDGHGMLGALQAELTQLLGVGVDLGGVPGGGERSGAVR